MVLSETSITYIDDANGESLEEPLKQASIFVTWTRIDAQRYLLADDYGKLYLLMLLLDDAVVTSWKLDILGDISRASVLTYLESGMVFIGSHQGDSQLIRILDHEIEVLQTFPNIAPILDFTIMDMGNRGGEIQTNEYSSGQARIVTGSGAFQDGSLRSVRSGVGMEDQGILGEMDHVTELFSLCSSSARDKVDLLAAAFVDETRVFQFHDDEEIEERREFAGLVLSEGSLHISNISSQRLLQVTKLKAHILDLESGIVIAEWSVTDGQTIIAATANKNLLALSIGSSEVVILDLNKDLEVSKRRPYFDEGQIACIHLSSIFPHICIVGFWESTCVAVLDVLTLEILHKVVMSEDITSVPRAVLLTQLNPQLPPTLFIAMANGEVITYSLDPQSYALSSRKATILGTQQASFKELPRTDGLYNVFAVCEHPSLIYGSEGRIVYAAVTAESTTCVCPFDSSAFPGAIAIATKDDLRISLVDTERTTHVQTLMIKETVRRIAYSKTLKAFGMGTIYRELQNNYEVVQSHFKLADEVLFKELDTYDLHEEELVESCIRADLRDGSGEFVERFVVGTTLMEGLEPDGARGRIIVFAVTPERKLKVAAELSVKGACRTLGVVDGNIVAGLVKTVYSLNLSPSILICKVWAKLTIAFSPGHRVLSPITLPDENSHIPYFHRAYLSRSLRQSNRHL